MSDDVVLERMFYISRATRPMSRGELEDLLHGARARNVARDITGMLLYDGGHFAQVVEGPQETVRRLFQSIQRDQRHSEVVVICEGPVEQRDFPGWAMGYSNLDGEKEPNIEEIKTMMRTQDVRDPVGAYRFLLAFQRTG